MATRAQYIQYAAARLAEHIDTAHGHDFTLEEAKRFYGTGWAFELPDAHGNKVLHTGIVLTEAEFQKAWSTAHAMRATPEHRLHGRGLKRRRLNLCYTQEGFAKALGVSVATLRDWEQGRRIPRMQPMVEQTITRLEQWASTPTGNIDGVPYYTRPNLRTPPHLGGEPLYDPESNPTPHIT